MYELIQAVRLSSLALSRGTPKSYGELRKLLAELGDPWLPDPTLSDDEPLPEYPTGGDGEPAPPDRVLPKGGVMAVLEGRPPTHPELHALWREEGLLAEAEEGSAPTTAKRSRRKKTPAPDQGG